MNKDLKGKVSVVTGAANGLGKGISLKLAGKGSKVALVDVNKEDGLKVCSEIISEGGEAIYVQCDLKNEDEIQKMVNTVVNEYGKVDILVNNAGIGGLSTLWETPTEVWDSIQAVNLRGAFLCTKHIVPFMIKQKSGRIINISSAVGKQAQAMMAAYAVSKAGMISMTVALAKEVAEYGITVNSVCPGPVDTSWWNGPKKVLSSIFSIAENDIVNKFTNEKQIIKMPLTPEDIANVVTWLTTNDTKMITGQAISVDGGHEFPTY